MKTKGWTNERLMQLPDWCFGERFEIMFGYSVAAAFNNYYISDIVLPDYCVLWELHTDGFGIIDNWGDHYAQEWPHYRLVFADEIPDATTILTLPSVLTGVAETDDYFYGTIHLSKLRKCVHSARHRVALYVRNVTATYNHFSVSLVFSQLPKKVPDWLVK